MKSGYLYVLVHPSDPDIYKIGVTVVHPEKRLAQHNSQLNKHAGRIVNETGQKWELKTYIAVPDPYWAERAFWAATVYSVMPYRGGVEVEKMPLRAGGCVEPRGIFSFLPAGPSGLSPTVP
jgi:hypothetical protein